MYKHFLAFTALAGSMACSLAASPAEAQVRRGHSVSVQGLHGRGFVKSRAVTRGVGYRDVSRNVQTNHGRGYNAQRSAQWTPGSYSSDRSVQANNGRGYTSARDLQWGNGSFSGGRTTTTNNGTTFGHSRTLTDNGDGTASYNFNRTRPDGTSRSRSGTLERRD